jgi:hypothetical protein
MTFSDIPMIEVQCGKCKTSSKIPGPYYPKGYTCINCLFHSQIKQIKQFMEEHGITEFRIHATPYHQEYEIIDAKVSPDHRTIDFIAKSKGQKIDSDTNRENKRKKG